MLAHVLPLQDDELLYSWVARMGLYLKPRFRQHLVLQLWGDENRRSKVDLPLRLAILAERADGVLGTGQDVLNNATLFPFYAPFLDSKKRAAIADGMIGGDIAGARKVNALTSLRLRTPSSLRFCPDCWRDDEIAQREPYWRRSHQCSGVLVCHVHEKPLHYSAAKWAAREGVQEFCAAEQIRDRKGRAITIEPGSLPSCLKVAVGAHWLLTSHPVPPDTTRWSALYREAFAERQLVRPNGRISVVLPGYIEKQIGLTLMNEAAGLSRRGAQQWPASMLMPSRGDRSSSAPLRHLILMCALGFGAKDFFEGMAQPTLMERTLNRALQRPPMAPPKPPPVCRLRATEIATWWQDPAVSVCEMARRLGVAPATVVLHATRVGLHFPRAGVLGDTRTKVAPKGETFEARRDRWRNRFLGYRRQFPTMSQKDLERAGKPGMWWLQRHDRQWLVKNRCQEVRKGGAPTLNWEHRDEQLLLKVPRVVGVLRRQGKLVNFSSVGRFFGFCLVNVHKRLPRTAAAIRSLQGQHGEDLGRSS